MASCLVSFHSSFSIGIKTFLMWSTFAMFLCYTSSMSKSTMESRFWAKVHKKGPDECWPWTAGGNKLGYGRFSLGGSNLARESAHRVCWLLTHGELPKGINAHIHHRCHNKLCCNPSHLAILSSRDHRRLHVLAEHVGWRTCDHPVTPENTKVYGRRRIRACLTCYRKRQNAYDRARRKTDRERLSGNRS